MSLNQLTANYTDSEGEDEEKNPARDISPHYRKRESNKDSSPSFDQRDSPANTPKKKMGKLVSYANEDEDEDIFNEDLVSDEDFNSEPMDTGTENGEEETYDKSRNLGIKLPLAPPGKCSESLQKKVAHMVSRVKRGDTDYNKKIQNNKEFRNPSIYEKLIEHLGLDEMGSNYPLEMFDPHCWGKESYYDELSRMQKEEMDRREKERKEKTKVDIITGTKKPEEDLKKRKSRFDQALPAIKPAVPPPTLTAVPSANKTSINAFGSLKKNK